MEITLIGYFILPLGLLLSLNTKYVYYAFLFFVPFSASSVINIESITFGLQIPYYLAILWILKILIVRFIKNNFYIDKTTLKFLMPIVIFWIIALLSLIMPIVLEHKILVHYPEDPFKFSPLEFKRIYITQFLYLTFVMLVLIFTTLYVNTREKFYKSLKILLLSAVFVCIWGLFQFIAFYTNIPYPYWLFNNNIGYSQGYNQTIFGVVKRISSVLTEPSKLAGYLLWILPLFMVLYSKNAKSIIMFLSNLLILLILLISTSTTAYAGVVFNFIVIVFYSIAIKKKKLFFKITFKKRIFINFLREFMIAIFVIILTIFTVLHVLNIKINILEALEFVTTEKFATHSGIERGLGALKSFDIFLHEPLLGVGWGSNRSFDLNTMLLSNTGILGFVSFWFFIYQILKQLYKISLNNYLSLKDRNLSIALFFSIMSGIFAHVIADPDIIDLIMWVILGLSISFIRLIKKEMKTIAENNY